MELMAIVGRPEWQRTNDPDLSDDNSDPKLIRQLSIQHTGFRVEELTPHLRQIYS